MKVYIYHKSTNKAFRVKKPKPNQAIVYQGQAARDHMFMVSLNKLINK